MENKYIALIFVTIIVIAGVGYFAYQDSQSKAYNNYLRKSDKLWLDARSSFTQINMENESSKTNILYVTDSIGFTDQAINYTQEMIKTAPDNSTKKFAQIRLEQYQESKKVMGLYLQIFEKLRSDGVDEAIKTAQTLENQLMASTQKLNSLQTQLIELVNSDPTLKDRLIKVLGKERVNEMLQEPGTTAAG
ncbi:MAG: hypothetical protein ACP5C3_03505 [Methanomicrobiales archaeon]